MSKDFLDAVVVVTGASTGLGRAIAQDVAGRGARAIVINYASHAVEAQETAELVKAGGAIPVLVKADVAEEAGCRQIAAAAEPFGKIDALFNNAGVTTFAPDHSDLDAVNADDFLRLYKVNVVGAFQMIRAARTLLQAGGGVSAVVNTSSLAGATGIGSSVPYVASKGALTTMTLSLARALAPQIRVNAICPGFVDTAWFGKSMQPDALDRLRREVAASVPLRVASTAEDVSGAAVFLASPAARHITGEILLVDAGMHLGGAPLSMR